MHLSIDRTVHTTAFDKPVVDHWLERKIACELLDVSEKEDGEVAFHLPIEQNIYNIKC